MSESSAASDATTGESAEQEPEVEVFANRAERRAKGKKGSGGGEVFSKGQQPVGRGSVQSPRQYGNRRSG
jgi:hypothetical protein